MPISVRTIQQLHGRSSPLAVPFALASTPTHQPEGHEKIVAPARTLRLVEKSSDVEPLPAEDPHAVPKGSHWVDMTESNTIMVIEQPQGQSCAAIGGIMAQKMKVNGVSACIIDGRVRDIEELKASGLPVSMSIRSPFSRVVVYPWSILHLRVLRFRISIQMLSPGSQLPFVDFSFPSSDFSPIRKTAFCPTSSLRRSSGICRW